MDFKRIGRPPKYETPEQMEKDMLVYFHSLMDDKHKVWVRQPTVSGLAFHLGMSTRALLDYNKKDEFLPIVTRGKAMCELFLEENAITNKSKNPLSLLSMNFGRTEVTKQTIEHTGKAWDNIVNARQQSGIEEENDDD